MMPKELIPPFLLPAKALWHLSHQSTFLKGGKDPIDCRVGSVIIDTPVKGHDHAYMVSTNRSSLLVYRYDTPVTSEYIQTGPPQLLGVWMTPSQARRLLPAKRLTTDDDHIYARCETVTATTVEERVEYDILMTTPFMRTAIMVKGFTDARLATLHWRQILKTENTLSEPVIYPSQLRIDPKLFATFQSLGPVTLHIAPDAMSIRIATKDPRYCGIAMALRSDKDSKCAPIPSWVHEPS